MIDTVTQPIVIAFLLLQGVSVLTVWSLDTTSMKSENIFAVFVAVNLVAFSMISYVFRADDRGDFPNKSLLYLGISFVLVLLLAAVFV